MDNKEFNYASIYISLGLCAIVLILSGIFLPNFLNMIEVNLKDIIVKIMQGAFIISGILDIGLAIYAKKKLKQALIISLLIGLFFTVIFMSIPEVLLKFIFSCTYFANS